MTYEGGLIEAWKNKKRQEGWGEQHSLYLSCSFDSLAYYLNTFGMFTMPFHNSCSR